MLLRAPKDVAMKIKVLVHVAEEGGYWEAAKGWIEVAAERTPSNPLAQVVEVEL